jgi:hypothetical protein
MKRKRSLSREVSFHSIQARTEGRQRSSSVTVHVAVHRIGLHGDGKQTASPRISITHPAGARTPAGGRPKRLRAWSCGQKANHNYTYDKFKLKNSNPTSTLQR